MQRNPIQPPFSPDILGIITVRNISSTRNDDPHVPGILYGAVVIQVLIVTFDPISRRMSQPPCRLLTCKEPRNGQIYIDIR